MAIFTTHKQEITKMKKQILLTVAGVSALIGVAMMDDDSVNIPVIQQNAVRVITSGTDEFVNIKLHDAYDTKNGGQVCYRVSNYAGTIRLLCVELVNNEYVLSVGERL